MDRNTTVYNGVGEALEHLEGLLKEMQIGEWVDKAFAADVRRPLMEEREAAWYRFEHPDTTDHFSNG